MDPGRRPGSHLLELIAHPHRLCVPSLPRALWSFWSWTTGPQSESWPLHPLSSACWEAAQGLRGAALQVLAGVFGSYWYIGMDLDVQFSLHHGYSNCPWYKASLNQKSNITQIDIFLCVCMYVFTMHAHVHVFAPGGRDWCWVSSLSLLFMFWDRCSSWSSG